MKYNYFFVDFDETVFNHYAYLEWVDSFLEQHNVIKGSFSVLVEDFHRFVIKNHRLYDHKGHIEKVTARSWEFLSGEIEKELSAGNHDFCYPEVHKALAAMVTKYPDVRLLTYGNGEYQRFKIKTCRYLSRLHLPIHVVNETKADFLRREFSAGRGVLIDDRYPLNLPENWAHIWVNRGVKLKQPQRINDSVIQVSNLKQFKSALKLLKLV
jgi:hypothetical protein